ncbi:hypothetical protein PENTCL1PPCAC_21566, partial [Pristionchus entomophagus]
DPEKINGFVTNILSLCPERHHQSSHINSFIGLPAYSHRVRYTGVVVLPAYFAGQIGNDRSSNVSVG